MVRSFAKLMTTLYRSRPPKLVEQNWTDRLTLMKLGLGLKLLGRERLRDLMRIVMINIYDVMNEHFSHAALKSTIALDAVTGTNMGPRSPNTVYSYLHRCYRGISGPDWYNSSHRRHGRLWSKPRHGSREKTVLS
ncbi:MAG: hypothetical protein CM15mP74_24730 [Halieaceae bacterium]|nr:MAG: hypothetical protein CM15mP74_24730 [Halieaceae bacterium]